MPAGNITEVSKSLRWLVYIALWLSVVSSCTGVAIIVIAIRYNPAVINDILSNVIK